MSILTKFRLPYRDDFLFGLLLLLAFILPLVFDLWTYEKFETIKFGLLLVFVGIGCLIFFRKYFSRHSSELFLRKSKPFAWALVLFWLWSVLATIFSNDINYSFFGFYPRYTNGLLFYTVWSILILLLASLNKEKLWFLIKILFFCASLTAVWGLLQSVGFGYYIGPTTEFFSRSAPSFLGNPNFSSMFVASLMPLGLVFLLGAKSFSARIYYSLALFAESCSIVIFASRGSGLALLLGFFVCIVMGLVFRNFVSKKLTLVFGLILLLVLVVSFGFFNLARPGSVASTTSFQDANIQTRLGVWKVTALAVKSKPIFGYGLGNFETVFDSHRAETSLRDGFFDDPHNLFLYLAVSGGLPLLLFFLCMVVFAMRQGIKNLKSSSGQYGDETVGLFGAVLVWMAAAFFTPVPIPCYVLLAFLLSAFFVEEQTFKLSSQKLKQGLLGFGWAAGGVLLLYGSCFTVAEHFFFAGQSAYGDRLFNKAAVYEKWAVRLNPINNLYYEYWAGSSIFAGAPLSEAKQRIAEFSKFHKTRSYTYAEISTLYYLLGHQTRDPRYEADVLSNTNKAIELDPLFANNYFRLSQYDYAFGDLNGSENALQKGLKLDGTNLEGWMFLAKIKQIRGDRASMVSAIETAAKYSGNDLSILNLLSLAKTIPDIGQLPFYVHLSVGGLD